MLRRVVTLAIEVDFLRVPTTPLQVLVILLLLTAAVTALIMGGTQVLSGWVDQRWPATEPLRPSELLWGEVGGHVAKTFRGLDLDMAKDLAGAMVEVKVPAGQYIVEQGDPPTHYYVIKTGDAEVVQRIFSRDRGEAEQVIRRYGPGDAFGEVAILRRSSRTASVRALSDCVVMQLPAEDFVAGTTLSAADENQLLSAVDRYLAEDRARMRAAGEVVVAPPEPERPESRAERRRRRLAEQAAAAAPAPAPVEPVVEPEPVVVEPEPVVVEPEPVAVEPEPVAGEPEPDPEPAPAKAAKAAKKAARARKATKATAKKATATKATAKKAAREPEPAVEPDAMTAVVEEAQAEPETEPQAEPRPEPEAQAPTRRSRRGRAIEAEPEPVAADAAPPAAPAVPTAPFYPSHRAPAAGLQVWDDADPSRPAREIFAAGTDLQVVERWGDWAHVRRSDGVEGWVDGRIIEAR